MQVQWVCKSKRSDHAAKGIRLPDFGFHPIRKFNFGHETVVHIEQACPSQKSQFREKRALEVICTVISEFIRSNFHQIEIRLSLFDHANECIQNRLIDTGTEFI